MFEHRLGFHGPGKSIRLRKLNSREVPHAIVDYTLSRAANLSGRVSWRDSKVNVSRSGSRIEYPRTRISPRAPLEPTIRQLEISRGTSSAGQQGTCRRRCRLTTITIAIMCRYYYYSRRYFDSHATVPLCRVPASTLPALPAPTTRKVASLTLLSARVLHPCRRDGN